MTDRPLFVYGTLCDPDVLAAVLGRMLPVHQRIAAAAPGFAAVHYPGRTYPALLARPGQRAPGLLIYGLSLLEFGLLDAFEGDEYRRAVIVVAASSGPLEAAAYLPTAAIPASAPAWTLEQWVALHKAAALTGKIDTVEALREQFERAAPSVPRSTFRE